MTQPHDLVGEVTSGHGLLGVVERDETGVLCHECGRWLGGLSWHIVKMHEMTMSEYRTRHGLPAGVPLISLGASAVISTKSTERVGSPGWRKFEVRRDATVSESQQAAAAASARASVGTRAGRAKAASQRFTGNGDRRRNDERWQANLDTYMAWWRRVGRVARQKTEDAEERRLGMWMSRQWQEVKEGRMPPKRVAALVQAGIPLEADGVRGRKWQTTKAPTARDV